MKSKIWEIEIGNNWAKKIVIAPTIIKAIAKARSKLHPFEKSYGVTSARLIATED